MLVRLMCELIEFLGKLIMIGFIVVRVLLLYS